MAKAIDKVRAAYNAGKRQLVVPEFDNLELWFGQLTTADMQAVLAREPKDSYEQDLLLLIHKAQDADGKPAFQTGDLHYLKTEADYVVLRRVIAFLYSTTALIEQEVKKQIEGDPSSASA
ncbi:MAG TPA: hypothetical protein VI729_05075 [Anaerolineales bacterium]|nr:hypothetical protein [Anaerolineales bacterium]